MESDMVLAFLDFFSLFWLVFSMALNYAIEQQTKQKPEFPWIPPDELDMPTQQEGVEYTIVFGTCWIENPVIAWWGDVLKRPYVKHYIVNHWGNGEREYYIAGWNYDMGAHLILTQGVCDGVKQIKVGDVIVWPQLRDPDIIAGDGQTTIEIDEPSAFGGAELQGGVYGTVSVQYGYSDQQPNDYLKRQLGDDISASRGLTAIVLEQVCTGMIPRPYPWAVLVKRTDVLTDGNEQWYVDKAEIYGGMNPVHILREIYTNTEWGFGKPIGKFADSVWQAAADTLYDEDFGMSIKWEQPGSTLEDFKNEILRHINGFVYEEPDTGYFVIKLVRDDYDAASLTVYDDEDVTELTKFSRGAVYEAVNHVYLRYWDRRYNKPVVIDYQNTALMDQQNGKDIVLSVDYLGVDRDELASKLLAREVYEASGFFAALQLETKRTMSSLRPGDVFKFSWPPLGIEEMILRVLAVDFGTLKKGSLKLKCIEDMFAVQDTAYAEPPETGWEDPLVDPEDMPSVIIFEAPFWDLVQANGLSAVNTLDPDSGFVYVCAARYGSARYRHQGILVDYDVLVRNAPSGDWYDDGRSFVTPGGTLQDYMPCNAADATITLGGMYLRVQQDIPIGSYAIIDDEIVKVKQYNGYDAVTDTAEFVVARGCLDTVPAYHVGESTADEGTVVYFADYISYPVKREFTAGDQPGIKVLPFNGSVQLDDAEATIHTAELDSRIYRPYPPGNFKINSVSYPVSFTGQPTLSWAHRDRTQQIDEITEHSDANVGPEAGTTYSIKIYDENNSLVRTVTGLTGTSYTYSWEDEMDDCGLQSADPLNSQLRFQLWSVRDGYASWQHYDIVVQRV